MNMSNDLAIHQMNREKQELPFLLDRSSSTSHYFDLFPVTNLEPSHPKVHKTLELRNPNDCKASICISELCKKRSIKLQLYCIVKLVKITNNELKFNLLHTSLLNCGGCYELVINTAEVNVLIVPQTTCTAKLHYIEPQGAGVNSLIYPRFEIQVSHIHYLH